MARGLLFCSVGIDKSLFNLLVNVFLFYQLSLFSHSAYMSPQICVFDPISLLYLYQYYVCCVTVEL